MTAQFGMDSVPSRFHVRQFVLSEHLRYTGMLRVHTLVPA